VSELELAVARFAERMIVIDDLMASGARVVVACSGGADSLALLALSRARGLDVIATYIDHGLRATSAHDAAIVDAAARRFGASFESERVAIEPGGNLEARARDARYAALEGVRVRVGAEATLVGHTEDDQAETVLLNFLRGSGSDGLAGMRPVNDRIRRPLLRLRRAETREICARLALAPVADVMNDDVHHRRVWLRREVLPALEAGAARDLIPVLARQADVLRDEVEWVESMLGDLGRPGEPLPVADIVQLPTPLARRAVRRWLGGPPAGTRDVDAVLSVARGESAAAELAGGLRVERATDRLVLVVVSPPPPPVPVALPGRIASHGIEIESWVEQAPPTAWPTGQATCVVDADAVGPTATLRAVEPGERFVPFGGHGTKLVFDALAESGVAASHRPGSLVLAAGDGAAVPMGTPLWVLGYRIDDRVRVTSRTRRFLWIAATRLVQTRVER
jgi:tRNA(Ile)-lysidine synthase